MTDAARTASRGDLRARAMLEAATDLFIAKGYAATSLDEVIERAGGSRRTLYARFGNKEGLFAAVVHALIEGILSEMGELAADGRNPEEGLVAAGTAFLDALLAPRVVAAFRIVIAEIPHFPELGAAFFEAGPETTYRRVAAYLDGHVARGTLAIADTDEAARQLVEMLKGDLHVRALLAAGARPDRDALEARVRRAVRIFLYGVVSGHGGGPVTPADQPSARRRGRSAPKA